MKYFVTHHKYLIIKSIKAQNTGVRNSFNLITSHLHFENTKKNKKLQAMIWINARDCAIIVEWDTIYLVTVELHM